MKNNIVLNLMVMLCILISIATNAYAQNTIAVTGKVLDSTTQKPVDFASVAILETRKKARVDTKGIYSITVPKAGTYTFVVRSTGLKALVVKLEIKDSTQRDFILLPLRVRGGGLVITGERNIQKLSRYTFTGDRIKEVPATFGDALGALSTLPGVIRSAGFFGPLTIRGAEPKANRYYFDDIPVYNPQHFGAIQSIFSNDMIREVDLFSSSFPAQFGSAYGAVLNITSIDEVDKLGGVAEIGIISSNVFFKAPFNNIEQTGTVCKDKCFGYIIAAGRVGYLSLLVPPIYKALTGDELTIVPEYWDYQVKVKYFISASHSIRLLFFGSNDYLTFVNEDADTEDTQDPLLANSQIYSDIRFHAQGFYYTYSPNAKFMNETLIFSSFNFRDNYVNIDSTDAAPWTKDLDTTIQPNNYGIKNKTMLSYWKKQGELKTGIDFLYYDFKARGKNLEAQQTVLSIPDFANPDLFVVKEIDTNIQRQTIGGFLENKLSIGGLTFLPGVRIDHLIDSPYTTIDPRGLLSYTFKSKTTISIAGGQYSSFPITNPYFFEFGGEVPDGGVNLKPVTSIHRAAGIEQQFDLYTIKLEGFYNTFKYLIPSQTKENFENDGTQKAYGIEILLRKDRQKGVNSFFGWISYTYSQSKFRSNQSLDFDPYGDTYINFDYEREHTGKLVAGYVIGNHVISGRFQLYSSFPYTPISGSEESPPGSGRYVRTFEGSKPNSEHFPLDHRLDVRYSYKSPYTWGSVKYFIEVINIYNNQPKNTEEWDYTSPYEKGENPSQGTSGFSFLIPNFGVEIRF